MIVHALPTRPCRDDPQAWEISGGDRSKATAPGVVSLALAAAAICNTRCRFRDQCADSAFANPPAHRCVQGGLIWEIGRGAYSTTKPYAPETWAKKQQTKPSHTSSGAMAA